jgi:3-hydroxybutyryl-CoA dehydratase
MYSLTDLSVGMAVSSSVVFDALILEDFKKVSSDSANVHIDELFAQNLGYKSKLVHGLLVQMPISSLVGMQLPGPNSVIVEISSKFHSPTYIDNQVDYLMQISKIMESQQLVQLRFEGKVKAKTVISGSVTTVFPEKKVK